MTSYNWLDIRAPSDFDGLRSLLAEEFAPDVVIPQLKAGISAAVGGVLVEFEYVDKDYRSTYYNFYAKKGRVYRTDCVRLHFFSDQISYRSDIVDLESIERTPEENYFGFIVLRPTIVWTIGRSVLSPKVRKGARGLIIRGQHKVHILGRTFRVWGFPSMDQHTDIAVCAQVWAASGAINLSTRHSWRLRQRAMRNARRKPMEPMRPIPVCCL